jgi:hypothetical protein
MFSYFFQKQTEPKPVEEWTILDQMQPLSPEFPPESLTSSIISEIDFTAITNTLEKSVDLTESIKLSSDDRAEMKRHHDLNKKIKSKTRSERIPRSNTDKPWKQPRRLPGGCKTERKDERKAKRLDLKQETRVIKTMAMH